MEFKLWMEDNIFGFKEPELPEPRPEDEQPIRVFAGNVLMAELATLKIGNLSVRRPFEDQVQWGSNVGAIRVRLTPNLGVSIERRIMGLEGSPLWITKQLYKIKNAEFAGREDAVAVELAEHVKNLAREAVDSAQAGYRDLHVLVRKITERVKCSANKMFTFQEVKKINDNNYNILLSVANYGQGKLVSRLKPGPSSGGIIDISYDPGNGTIKGIMTTIEVEESGAWEVDVPYFMGSFVPSQDAEEIVNTMMAGINNI